MEDRAAVATRVRAVVLDMGGVVVRLGDYAELVGGRDLSEQGFWAEWLASAAVSAFERGEIDAETFAESYVTESESKWGLTPNGFLRAFEAWPKGLYPGVVDTIQGIEESVVIGCLSNTNPLHWYGQKDAAEIQGLFARTYLSFELGLVKPGREIFRHLIADLDMSPGQILFVDDNQINVDAALAEGIVARRAKGPEELEAVLAGVLGPGFGR